MTEIRFYHLRTKTLAQALPEILGKAITTGRRAVVRFKDVTSAEKMNTHLWTYDAGSFLPHGGPGDKFAADQPVWLTADNDIPNGADMLVITDGADPALPPDISLCCDIFDGNDETAVAAARTRWASAKAAGHELAYWLQNEKGTWEKKAV